MKYSLTLSLIAMLILAPFAAHAEGTADILELVQTSRAKVAGFISTDDENVRNTLLSEISGNTQEVDMRTDTLLADEATPAATKEKLQEFKTIWAEFVATRDGEMIPAAQAGDKEKAKSLGQTVQAERLKKIQALLK